MKKFNLPYMFIKIQKPNIKIKNFHCITIIFLLYAIDRIVSAEKK